MLEQKGNWMAEDDTNRLYIAQEVMDAFVEVYGVQGDQPLVVQVNLERIKPTRYLNADSHLVRILRFGTAQESPALHLIHHFVRVRYVCKVHELPWGTSL